MNEKWIVRRVWGPVSDYEMGVYAARVTEVLQTLSEQQRCVLEKRSEKMSLEKASKLVRTTLSREKFKADYGKDWCDGLTRERVRQIEYGAVRKLRSFSRRSVWIGTLTGLEWCKLHTEV